MNRLTKPAIPTPLSLLYHILEEPEAVALIQHLSAAALGKLIRNIGLEDAGEIISLATTEQLLHVFDEDLWRNDRPGQEETFDARRFKLWLEVMMEADTPAAAAQLAGLGEDFVALALSQYLLVLNPNLAYAGEAETGDDPSLVDKALEANLTLEFASCLLVSQDDDAWEAVITLLTELDKTNSAFSDRVLARCRLLSADYIHDHGGLYEVLSLSQQLGEDLADERDQRRAQAGHVAPQDAAHFLRLINQASLEDILTSRASDPLTREYFSLLNSRQIASQSQLGNGSGCETAPQQLASLLREAPLLTGKKADLPPAASISQPRPLLESLAWLAKHDSKLHAQRLQELAYLANILLAGHANRHRRYRPAEAAQQVLEICEKGMEYLAGRKKLNDPANGNILLLEHDAVNLFKLGWKLYQG